MRPPLTLAVLGLVALACAINVHIVPHTHDDVGWLKTVDQYYIGSNNSIQDARVQYIFDSIISELALDGNRTFIYVETAYISKWWAEATEAQQDIFTKYVNNGQLELVSGGWVMNDEACTTFEAIVDQMSEGHAFLWNTFGVIPKIGWQIDPFGHSATYASLAAQFGFDGLFLGRFDYEDYAERSSPAVKQLEFMWRGSRSLGPVTEIFTHLLYGNTYCWGGGVGNGIAFEEDDDPIQNDPNIFNMNIQQMADAFVADIQNRSASYLTDQILIAWGCDFAFLNAHVNYKNMDKLMEYINANASYGVTVKYSTPNRYLAAVHAANVTWPVKTDDEYPYSSDPYSYWTGYYSSRQSLKGYERFTSNLLHNAQNIYSSAQGYPRRGELDETDILRSIDQFAQYQAIAQHHDAVSGTEMQHVADDYAMRLSIGQFGAYQVLQEVISDIITPKDVAIQPLQFCPLLNESSCPPLAALAAGVTVPVIVYNPLGYPRTEAIRLRGVPANVLIHVTDENNTAVPSQLLPNGDFPTLNDLVFITPMPQLGFTTVFLTATPSTNESISGPEENDTVTMTNGIVTAMFSPKGRLMSLQMTADGPTVSIVENLFYYNASAGNNVNSSACSDSYVLRTVANTPNLQSPNSSVEFPLTADGEPLSFAFLTGPIVQEITQVWTPWLTQTLRLYANAYYLESEFTIQPMPIDDDMGKELMVRYDTSLDNGNSFWSDANGQEMQNRTLDYRATYNLNNTEPIASNFYPMTSSAFLNDSMADQRFTIVSDRSHAVASLATGQLQVLLQRRLLYQCRGFDEALNETLTVRMRNWLTVGASPYAPAVHRRLVLLLNKPLLPTFGPPIGARNDWLLDTHFTPLSHELPENVDLFTLRPLGSGAVLFRLSHIFAADEYAVGPISEEVLSEPVEVDINKLFPHWSIIEATEMQLSGAIAVDDVDRLLWATTSPDFSPLVRQSSGDFVLWLAPMEIRTFVLQVVPGTPPKRFIGLTSTVLAFIILGLAVGAIGIFFFSIGLLKWRSQQHSEYENINH